MNEEKRKRPLGLVLLAILWLVSGILHIYIASEIIRSDLQALQWLSSSFIQDIPEWFGFVVPTELALSIIVLCLGVLQIFTIPGLLAGKKYSVRFTFAIPIVFVMVNIVFLGLYASAPAEIDLGNSMLFPGLSAIAAMFWIQVHFKYFEKPSWKTYLGVTQPALPVPGEQRVCNHCGAENKTDSETCEECGNPIA